MTTTFERKLIPFIRWTARIAGSLLFAFFMLFIFAHIFSGDAPNFVVMPLREQLMFLGLFLELIGIVLAWRWEGIGALLIIIGYAMFQIIEGELFTPPLFPVFLVVALMFGYCWLRGGKPVETSVDQVKNEK